MLVLTIGVVVFAVLLILVVASAAQVHLEHKRLVALADLLALEAADSIRDEMYYGEEGDARIRVTDASVRDAVESYLAEHPGQTRGWRQVAVQEATATGARTARVSIVARVRPRPPRGCSRRGPTEWSSRPRPARPRTERRTAARRQTPRVPVT